MILLVMDLLLHQHVYWGRAPYFLSGVIAIAFQRGQIRLRRLTPTTFTNFFSFAFCIFLMVKIKSALEICSKDTIVFIAIIMLNKRLINGTETIK